MLVITTKMAALSSVLASLLPVYQSENKYSNEKLNGYKNKQWISYKFLNMIFIKFSFFLNSVYRPILDYTVYIESIAIKRLILIPHIYKNLICHMYALD